MIEDSQGGKLSIKLTGLLRIIEMREKMQQKTNSGKYFAVLIIMESRLEVLIKETERDPQKFCCKLLTSAPYLC